METLVYLNNLDDKKVLTIQGKATMNTSKTISDMIDLLLSDNNRVCLDMTDCKYIDSTFLGLIADSTMKSKTINGEFITILNPNDIVALSLRQTGIENFVNIEKIDNLSEKLDLRKNLENKEFSSKLEHGEYVLKMHKILSELNDQNKETFKNVISQMEAILKTQK